MSRTITQESTMETNPDRDPADLAAERNLTVSLGVMPAIPEVDDRPPDEIRAQHLAEASAVDAHLDEPAELELVAEEVDPPTVREILDGTLANGTPVAFHLTAEDWAQLREDPQAMGRIEITSDGVTYRGVAIAVEGGVELPAPVMPEPAVYVEPQAEDWTPEEGDRVRYHPIIDGPDDGKSYTVRATESGHGGTRLRVWLTGKSGFVAVEALSPDHASEARDETGGPVQEGIDFGRDTGAH